ncbi:MAG: hypothetical protein JO250_17695 [Armatimonadetes bacterium]|nr:hypothetical protein [Armatimonadota bacterium]
MPPFSAEHGALIISRSIYWNGRLILQEDPGFKGQKTFDCSITLDAALASQDERWRTLIHEALHACSAGYVRDDFETFRGWEEGVVEKLQRLLRPQILARLGVNADDEVFRRAEDGHLYNRYLAALEDLQWLTGMSEQEFYVDLLGVPIKARIGHVLSLANAMSGGRRAEFIRTFSKSNAVLKGDARWSLLRLKKNTGNG